MVTSSTSSTRAVDVAVGGGADAPADCAGAGAWNAIRMRMRAATGLPFRRAGAKTNRAA
jgi:hypothetical protein